MRPTRLFPLLFALCVSVVPCEAQPPVLRVVGDLEAGRQAVRIVAFGDSITGVYYHTGGRRAWCDMLGIALERVYPRARLEMINAGISGNTTAAGLARMERDVIARRPHLVVVMFGMNDAVRTPREQFAGNLRTMVERLHASAAEVVLCTPNNVYANPTRPMDRLAQFAETVREVAREKKVPLADCHQAYEERLRGDPKGWRLLMSETIHPSMNGHKLFAEVMARAISGKGVSLADVAAPADTLRFTLARLRAGQPVSIVAMPPYDRLVPDALRERFPTAKIQVAPWPTAGRTLADLEQWARQIRKQAPHLVVVAVPADATAADDEAFVRSYAWVLNWSIDFGLARWDRLAILPGVTAALGAGQDVRQPIAEQVIRGADCDYLDRKPNDSRSPQEILGQWIGRQLQIVR
jgi:lysophospholipase L1-like esterase